MNKINKKLLKTRFKKSLLTYSDNAIIQNQMAKELLIKLNELKGNKFNKILEIGCGTGVLTKKIVKYFDFEKLLLNDIVDESLSQMFNASEKIEKIYGDCENISFPANLDLIISNTTFQWIEDLELLIKKLYSNLNPNGILAFTTFGEQNFYQIKKITGHSLIYYKQLEIEKILAKNFKIIYANAEIKNLEFDTAFEILKHLKLSGVNSLISKFWTKKDLTDFSEKYEKLFKTSNSKLVLTYQPLFFIVEKKC